MTTTIIQPGPISSQTQQALEALGYLSDPIEIDIAETSDPRSKQDIILELSQISNLAPTEAIEKLEKIVEANRI